MEKETATQERPNDVSAMEAQVKKANGEAAHYRNERNTLRDMVVTLKAERTLSEAGITNPKATKVLDFSKITVTESGELEGLTEQLETLREDFPELFGPVVPDEIKGADGAEKPEARLPKSTAQQVLEAYKSRR